MHAQHHRSHNAHAHLLSWQNSHHAAALVLLRPPRSCKGMVDKAAATGAKSVKFVPTVHYYGQDDKITSYCYR